MFHAIILLLFSSSVVNAKFCQNWGTATNFGVLDSKIISESSGIIISPNFGDRFYHVNDSGDGPYIYYTKMDGSDTQKIKISKFNPRDVEDLSFGQCGNSKCIIIGDIGDNSRSRKYINIITIEELEKYPETNKIKFSQKAFYPDGPKNCEAMAYHPYGDLFLITKVSSSGEMPKIFKIPSFFSEKNSEKIKKLEFVGNLNLKKVLKKGFSDSRITGMSISPEGEKFAILTYDFALEFNINLGKLKDWESLVLKEGENFNLIKLKVLPQQEAITYSKDGTKLYYSTEKGFLNSEAPIMEISCKD